MPYSLFRTRDGAGDSGQMSLAIINAGAGRLVYEENGRPAVGAIMRVGSHFARSYSAQDYWQTTPITEILEERTEDDGAEYVRFKTGNSEYEWKYF